MKSLILGLIFKTSGGLIRMTFSFSEVVQSYIDMICVPKIGDFVFFGLSTNGYLLT